MINTKSITEKEFVSKFIEPGVVEARITKVESTKASTGTWGLTIYFETAPVEGLNGAGKTATDRFWLSEKSTPITVNRLRKIADATGTRKAFDEINVDESQFGNTLHSLFSGKVARFVFSGEEVAGKDGKPNWYKAKLYSGFSFVEPLSVNPTKLTYNESMLVPLKTVNTNAGTILNHKTVNTDELY